LGQWASGNNKCLGILWNKTPAYRASGENSGKLVGRISSCVVERKDHTKPVKRIHVILFGVWSRSGHTNRIIHDSPRITLYIEDEFKEDLEDDFDLLEEARELALSMSAVYQ
jgi:hypothetical protein